MQQLSGYGITLNRLDQSTIEQVRLWRNLPGVADNMEFNRHITGSEQLHWFASLDKKECYYFTIAVKQKPIGLVHLNQFDENARSANVGLFIGDEQYVGTGVSLAASLLILEFAFEQLGLALLHAKVKDSNATAIQYNTFLGFRFSEKLNGHFSAYHITRHDFMGKKAHLVKLANHIIS
ncbi:MAG: GNAT family N-acetyltransferase [Bacteroidota bacterium]